VIAVFAPLTRNDIIAVIAMFAPLSRNDINYCFVTLYERSWRWTTGRK
jgi:hypothetical protein